MHFQGRSSRRDYVVHAQCSDNEKEVWPLYEHGTTMKQTIFFSVISFLMRRILGLIEFHKHFLESRVFIYINKTSTTKEK